MSSTPAVGTKHETHLTVLLADEDERALRSLGDVLQGLGHDVTPFAVSVEEAAELIGREDPDLTIVVVHQDDDHALALIAEAVEIASGPVIAQLRGRDDVDFVARAADHRVVPSRFQRRARVSLPLVRFTHHPCAEPRWLCAPLAFSVRRLPQPKKNRSLEPLLTLLSIEETRPCLEISRCSRCSSLPRS